MELLIQHGANVNVEERLPYCFTPLYCAAQNGHLDIVKLLLRYNAKVFHGVSAAPPRLTDWV